MNVTLEDMAAMWPTMPKEMREALVDSAGRQIALGFRADVLAELGHYLGEAFAVPIAFAVRISGWNERWIRRNLPLIDAEGQHATITIHDLKEAMEKRKTK